MTAGCPHPDSYAVFTFIGDGGKKMVRIFCPDCSEKWSEEDNP